MESSKEQAEEIFRITRKPVFYVGNFTMINDESWLNKKKEKTRKWYHSLKNMILTLVSSVIVLRSRFKHFLIVTFRPKIEISNLKK